MDGFIPTPQQLINEDTRKLTLSTLLVSLTSLLKSQKSFSELQLRDNWLANLRKNTTIFPDGWYIPPPHGIGALIGDTSKQSRTNYDNLRRFTPLDTVYFDEQHPLLYAYASPVDKKTGIIGDSGGTFYRGTNPDIQQHLKRCFDITINVAKKINAGMTFADVFYITMDFANKYNFVNEVISVTDPSTVNIGHTIPPGFSEWSKKEQAVVKQGNWQDILDIIRNKRIYVNAKEQTKLQPGTMVTIEPRFTVKDNPNIPMASYHTTLHIGKNGKIRLLTEFQSLFTLFGMDYMV
jgi:hypothetical protein